MLDKALETHYVSLPRRAYMDCRPQYIDFAFMPECRAIVDVPSTETVTADQIAAIIPALATRWDADRKKELMEYIRPYLGEVSPNVDPLDLAISIFTFKQSCYTPIGVMRYPSVLAHKCNHCRTTPVGSQELAQDDAYTFATKTLTWWSAQDLQAYKEGANFYRPVDVPLRLQPPDPAQSQTVATMRQIVNALGLDPASATFDELERCEMWLRCVACETANPTKPIYAWSWRGAVRYCSSSIFSSETISDPTHALCSTTTRPDATAAGCGRPRRLLLKSGAAQMRKTWSKCARLMQP